MSIALTEIHSFEYIISIKPWFCWCSKQNFFTLNPLVRQLYSSHLQQIISISIFLFRVRSIEFSWLLPWLFRHFHGRQTPLKRVTTLESSLLILQCLGFTKIKKSSLLAIWIWLSKTVIISNRISMVSLDPRPGKIVMKKLMTLSILSVA